MGKENIKNIIIVLLVIVAGFLLFKKNPTTPTPTKVTPPTTTADKNDISIDTKKIKDTNFSGSMPVISGSSKLALESISFVNRTIDDFKKQADIDVPDMRAKFGADAPMAQYTIDIQATHTKGPKTESIIISVYAYTGGANGNSTYKVFTSSIASGSILSLADIIKKDKQITFTTLVEKELNAWAPSGSTAPVVFPDEVKALTFASFSNWSLDNKNLTIYFDKYAVGPGVLGPIAFPIPLQKISSLLSPF